MSFVSISESQRTWGWVSYMRWSHGRHHEFGEYQWVSKNMKMSFIHEMIVWISPWLWLHCVSVFTNIRKIELRNRCHRIQVYAWVHQFPSRFTPVKGLSLTILALKWFGNHGIKKVKGCLQSTWWERILCVLCGQLCCCVFVLQWLEQGGKIQKLLMWCHYYPKSLKSN